jgi:ribonuclease PH
MRPAGRAPDQLRPISFQRGFTRAAAGSVLASMGRTVVLCTCSVEANVPPFLVGTGKGWLTAEYSMLPGSTKGRKSRDRAGKIDGRSIEIQRLIGRSLRAVVDLSQLGERTVWLDCDVLDADGGTRTTAINGAFVALADALAALAAETGLNPAKVVTDSIAAVSVGLVDGEARLDLEYVEDRGADVDMNIVMTGAGRFIEVQGAGEEATFGRDDLNRLIDLATAGITQLTAAQRSALGEQWPLDSGRRA